MKFGLKAEDWALVQAIAVEPLKSKKARVYVFGSRARGDAKYFSDLDLLIEPSVALDPQLLSEIRSKLEESNLPIKVDLVLCEDLPNSFVALVDQEKIELQ